MLRINEKLQHLIGKAINSEQESMPWQEKLR
jgi:hypothetical protein